MTEQQRQAKQQLAERKPAGGRRRWPALVKRFPSFRRRSEGGQWRGDWPVVPPTALNDYPALADDLTVWRDQIESRFRKLDHRTQILQNLFWRQRVLLIAGGLLATSLATAQAAVGGGNVYLAVIQAVLTGLLAGLTVLIRSRRAQQGYLSARLKAERIKSEFFVFLAMADPYKDAGRIARLLQQVDDIEAEGVA
jgi:hypothetical protein